MRLRCSTLAVLAACVVALFLGGCASSGLTLYSDTRDKQGQDVKKAWGEVDFASQLSVPRKNIKTLLDEQLAMEDEIWAVHRSSRAREMTYDWTLKNFQDQLHVRLSTLTSATAAKRSEYRATQEKAQGNLNILANNFAGAGLPPPKCPIVLDKARFDSAILAADKLADGNVRTMAITGLASARDECRALEKLNTFFDLGELGAARQRLKDEQDAIKRDEATAAELKKAYDDEKDKYEAAAKALLGNPDDVDAKKKVAEALGKLQALVGKIKAADDAFSAQFVSEERLASLDGFLKTYQDAAAGKAVVDGNKLAIALAVFPDVADKARKALSDVEKPKLAPLAIQKNIELVKLEAARKDIALRRQVVSELEARLAALDAQVQAIGSALDPFEKDPAVQALGSKKLFDVMSANDKAGLTARTKLWKATTRYLDAEGRLRAEAVKANYRVSALSHERALTYAESNINQWKALIDPSVELMAAYGAAGLKSSDIIALFNSLTLLWIGAGVH